MGHCMCLCVCVCFRGTDLFPHREDSPCLIREERLRARQGDGQMRGGKKKKKKKKMWRKKYREQQWRSG